MRRVAVLTVLFAVVLAAPSVGAEIPSFYDLRVEGIEITQGVQTEGNDLLLFDARPTTVRVYVDFAPSVFSAISNVEARLEIYDGTTRIYRGHAYNGPATLPRTIDREDPNASLNFDWLPDLRIFGTDVRDIRFRVVLDPVDRIHEYDESNNVAEFTFPFECRGGPDIAYIPIDYTFENADPSESGEPDPDLIEPGVGDAFVWGIFPFSQGPRDDQGRYRASNLEALEWDRDVDTSFSDLLAEVERQRVATSPTPDHLYAWQRGNPYSGNGRGDLPGSAAFGNTDTTRHQRTFAHELGHNLGFFHVSNSTGEVGWDVGDRLGIGTVKGPGLFDIMVGGQLTDTAWIDPGRYENVYQDPEWTCQEQIPDILREFLEIPILDIDREWHVGPLLGLYARRPEIVRQLEGRGVLELLDAEGAVLYAQHFDPIPSDGDAEGAEARGATVLTPNVPGVEGFEVRIDGQPVERRTRTPAAPRVEILSPEPGETIGDGTEIAWTMNDEDSEVLHAFARYSPDGESRWIPLGPRTTSTSMRLRPGNLPSTEGGVIEVRVTDGFNVATATVGSLQLGPNRPPRVHVLFPRDGHETVDEAVLTLVGDAVDPEDGTLTDGLNWYSSLDGFLGEGPRVEVSEGLSDGTHVIDLIATDSGGAEALDTVVVHVDTLSTGASPGEASGGGSPAMRVTGYDRFTGAITVSYDPACGADDHAVHVGPLAAVDAYDYDQTYCDLGTSGTATFTPVGDAVFFLLVGEDGLHEGSYGLDGFGNERPERFGGGTCGQPQALAARCD